MSANPVVSLVAEPSLVTEQASLVAGQEGQPATAVGYVEAMTGAAVLGWAWTPGRPEKVAVELRLGAEVVAEAVADEMREDLARSGIGDGRHAFALEVPERLRPRMTELRVVARTPEGEGVALGSPPVEDGLAERLGELRRGMEVLAASQRVLHRNVQAVLVGRGDASEAATIAAGQAELRESIATLELFVVRLEHGLSGLRPAAELAAPPRWALAGVAGVALLALATSVWALCHVMPG